MPTATKPKINCRRLLKLADFLDKLPRSHFNFDVVNAKVEPTERNECGTVGCAIGWCPTVFPRVCKIGKIIQNEYHGGTYKAYARSMSVNGEIFSDMSWHASAGARLFGITENDAYRLFTPHEPSPADAEELAVRATAREVADRIRTYVKWHKAGRK